MIWDEFLRHFRFCDEEDSGLSDEEQERKGPKNRPKHARKRIHQAKKNFLEKFKTASYTFPTLLFVSFTGIGCAGSNNITNVGAGLARLYAFTWMFSGRQPLPLQVIGKMRIFVLEAVLNLSCDDLG